MGVLTSHSEVYCALKFQNTTFTQLTGYLS